MAPAPADMDNGQPPPNNDNNDNNQLSPIHNGEGPHQLQDINGEGPHQLQDINAALREQIGRTSLQRRTQLLDAMETIVQGNTGAELEQG